MPAQQERGRFGELVSQLRTAARLTQEELAERTGLSVRAVSDLERNRVARPRRETISRLAAAFGLRAVTAEEFHAAARSATRTGGTDPIRPAQLPMDTPDFVGRTALIAEVCGELTGAGNVRGEPAGATPVVYAFSGPPGVGKSTLAVHLAHQVRHHFPDGQVFADLGGVAATGPAPVPALTATVLRAFGVSGRDLPDETAERIGLLRSVLADRRVLIVCDDAATEAQVRAVLPGTAGSALLVTSRHPLAGLAGARFVAVPVLAPEESLTMLRAIAGPARVGDETESAREVTQRCGHLPLAIRVVGARLAVQPDAAIGAVCAQLAVESRRLDELTAGDLGVRASIALSEDLLTADDRRMLRLLTLLDAPTITGWAATAMLHGGPGPVPPHGDPGPAGSAAPLPAAGLDALVRASLLDEVPVGGGRTGYRFHDLIRAYGRERAAAELDEATRAAAVRRGIGAHAVMADLASRHMPGGSLRLYGAVALDPATDHPADGAAHPAEGAADPAAVADPLEWFDSTRPALVAALGQALDTGFTPAAVIIADAMVDFWATRGHFDEWRGLVERTWRRCRELADTPGTARMAQRLAEWHVVHQRFDRADELLTQALALFRSIGDAAGQANAWLLLGSNERSAGRLDAAAERLTAAAELFTAAGVPAGTAHALVQAAIVDRTRGDYDEALRRFDQALVIFQAVGDQPRGDQRGVAQALLGAGLTHLAAGDLAAGATALADALAAAERTADRRLTAQVVATLGDLRAKRGELPEARRLLVQAEEMFTELGLPDGLAFVSQALGALLLALGEPAQAARHTRTALGLYEAAGVPVWRARTTALLGDIALAAGASEEARRHWSAARQIFDDLGLPEAHELDRRLG
ncbi:MULTISPECIES: ATP-binding protein [unclassified Micromonospora]|uniref:ATP-binding protein n=1 Tax=unclassified Micromonospora TaxID=2617518 RepID=UPI00363BC9F2